MEEYIKELSNVIVECTRVLCRTIMADKIRTDSASVDEAKRIINESLDKLLVGKDIKK